MSGGRVFEVVNDATVPEDDVEAAFNDWRQSFEDSESPGSVRAYRIPLDEHGHASHSASGQIRLGKWPVDQYDFDSLCDKIMREFMLPNESMMAVRLMGTLAGKAGVRFNKIVTLQRPNALNALPNPGAKDGVADIMRSMQEGNERMLRMMQEMRGGTSGQDGANEMMRTVAMMRVFMEPMTTMMGPILAAVAGRPLPAAAPGGSMKETLETLMMMDRFLGKRGGGGSSEPDWMKLTTAVAGVATPLLQLAVNNKAQEPQRSRRSMQPTPAPPVQTAQTTPPPSVPPAAPIASGVDLSRPSTVTTNPLSAAHDISAPSPTPQPVGDPQMFAEMKARIDTLVKLAEEKADPTGVADLFFEQGMMSPELTEAQYGALANLIESESFLTQIAIYNGRVREHAAFFNELRRRLMERITQEDSQGG